MVPVIVEVFGGIASKGAQYLRFLARRASDKKRGRDGTAYSDYHASGGFLSHHFARISTAAVYWDARHIDEGVTFLKQRAAATMSEADRPPPAVARAPDMRPLAVFHP